MTYEGLINRLKMTPKIFDIALESFKLGVYARQDKYLKYDADFRSTLSKRDPAKGFTVTEEEAYTLYSAVKSTAHIDGVAYTKVQAQRLSAKPKVKNLFIFLILFKACQMKRSLLQIIGG